MSSPAPPQQPKPYGPNVVAMLDGFDLAELVSFIEDHLAEVGRHETALYQLRNLLRLAKGRLAIILARDHRGSYTAPDGTTYRAHRDMKGVERTKPPTHRQEITR